MKQKIEDFFAQGNPGYLLGVIVVALGIIPLIAGNFAHLLFNSSRLGLAVGTVMFLLPIAAFCLSMLSSISQTGDGDTDWLLKVYSWFFAMMFPLGAVGVVVQLFVVEATTVLELYWLLTVLYAVFFFMQRIRPASPGFLRMYKAITPIALAISAVWGFWGVEGYTSLSVIMAILSLSEIYRFWLGHPQK